MNLLIIILEFLLAFVLFFIMNLLKNKNINRIDTIIIPNLSMIILASIFPKLKDYMILLIFFYLIFDFIYIFLITKQGLFKNEKVYYINSLLTLLLSFLIYHFFLLKVKYTFVNMEVFKNFIWILIIIYFYQKLNIKSINLDKFENDNKNKNYQEFVIISYAKFKNKYNYLIKTDSLIEDILYSFMIYETYKKSNNYLLYLKDKIKNKNKSYGIMNIETNNKITDEESIVLIKEKLENKYKKIKKNKDNLEEKLIKERYKQINIIKEIENILNIIREFKNK